MVVPYVDVSHLASASSFYSAVLQPLGLSYINLEPTGEDQDPPASVTYGFDGEPVLQIRQNPTPLGPLRLSSLVLTAPSRSAVIEFHACGLRANPPLLLPGGQRPWLGFDGGVSRAVVYDLNGNKMEAFYPDDYSAQDTARYSSSASRKAHSNRQEAGRILHWNYDVASTRPSTTASAQAFGPAPTLSPYHQQHQRQQETPDHAYTMSRRSEQSTYPLRRSLTHDPPSASSARPYSTSLSSATAPHSSSQRQVTQTEPIQSDSPRQSSLTSGLSTTTVLGALLGVAAGAAVTYGLVSQDRGRKPVQEVDAAPLLPRRATFPEKIPSDRRSRHDDRGSTFSAAGQRKPVDDYYVRGNAPDYPPRKCIEDYSARKVVYADVAEDCENVWPPPRYLPHTTHAYEPSIGKPASHVRDVDEAYDTRSRHSSRHQTGRTASVRSRSETPLDREPTTYILSGAGLRSYAPSRHSAVPRSSQSQAQSRSHRSTHEADRESYVSARTHRSASTTRPPRVRVPLDEEPYMEHDVVVRSRAGSRASVSRPPISGSQAGGRRSSSRARSQVSAKHVPLPMSGVGSSHANWDDDLISLAPSDSISCVGSKSSRRSHRHQH